MRESLRQHFAFVEGSPTGASDVAHRMAKERGLYVSLFTRNPDAFSGGTLLENTDAVVRCETNDADALAAAARAHHRQLAIDGLTTLADLYVPQTAEAACALGLPSLSYEAALAARNKYRMRAGLAATCPELNPPFRLVADADEALAAAEEIGLPLVAKPQDGNDSRDVRLIRSPRELEGYMTAATRWHRNAAGQEVAREVLLEGYLEGDELSVETVQKKGGEIRCIGVVHKSNAGVERGYFPEDGAFFPAAREMEELLFPAVARALAALEIDCGAIHTELRLVDGQPKILEINPRLIGNRMGSHVIPLATGHHPVAAVIDIALGTEGEVWPAGAVRRGAAMWGVCADRTGRFQGIANLDAVKRLPGVVYVDVIPRAGSPVRLPETNEDIVAWITTVAASGEAAAELAREACHRTVLAIAAA